jgi:hypothetical protein
MKTTYNEVTCPNCSGYTLVPMCHQCCGTGQVYEVIEFSMAEWFGAPVIAPRLAEHNGQVDGLMDKVQKH